MLLLALALPAHAVDYDITDHLPTLRTSPDKLYANPGTVTLDGVVELPMYGDGPGPQVEMVLPDGTPQVVAIAPENSWIRLTEATVTALGGEKKSRKVGQSDMEVATVSFELGGAQFDDVLVEVGSSDQLGLLAFTDLAVGVYNTEGVVRLASAGELTLEGGTRTAYTRLESTKFKDGARKGTLPAYGGLVTGTWNDLPATMLLHFNESSSVAGDLAGDLEPLYRHGGSSTWSAEVAFDGTEPATLEFGQSNATTYSFHPYEVTLGTQWTSVRDIVFDGQGTVAISTNDGTPGSVTRNSWSDRQLELALEGLEKPEDAEADWVVPAAAYSALAAAYADQFRDDEALEQAQKAFDATEEPTCDAYTALGYRQARAGDYDAAIESYTEGLALYDVWGDIDATDRVAILEEKAKVEEGVKLFGFIPIKKPGEWTGEVVQPHSCDTDRAALVSLHAIQGNWDAVDTIWAEDRDVDVSLGHAAAAAFVAQGRYDDALSALSWAVSNGTTDYYDKTVPLAYALIQDQQGKTDQAWSNYERAITLAEQGDLLTWRAYAAAHAARNGRDATAKHMSELAQGYVSPAASLVAAEAVQAAGGDATQALADAVAEYQGFAGGSPTRAEFQAGLSSALLRTGDVDGAKAAAEKALELDPLHPLAHLAMGDVMVLAGDESAGDHYRQAAVMDPTHPLLATML